MHFPQKSASSGIFYSDLCNSFLDAFSQFTNNASPEIIN